MSGFNARKCGLHRIVGAATLLAVVWLPAVAAEPEGAKLFDQKRCYICHDKSKASLGPPLVAIAARHAARRDVMVDVLAHKIVHGGGGNWGVVPMVPNQWVSLAEARVLAEWVLGQSTSQGAAK